MDKKYILSKESIHGIKLYAEVCRDGSVIWRVERGKATELTDERAREVIQRYVLAKMEDV